MLKSLLLCLKESPVVMADAINTNSGGFGAFAFMKPLEDALVSKVGVLSSAVRPILGGVDILIIIGIAVTIFLFVFGIARFHFKGMKSKDETVDNRQVEAERKQELKKVIKGGIGMAVIFILIPVIVLVVGEIIS